MRRQDAFRIEAPINSTTPTECLEHIGAVIARDDLKGAGVPSYLPPHADDCRCVIVPIDGEVISDHNPIRPPPFFPQGFHENEKDPTGCVMFFKSQAERDAFMKWFADVAMRAENLP